MMLRRSALLLLLLPWCGPVCAVPVAIRAVETSAPEMPGFPLGAATDGLVMSGHGWRLPGPLAAADQSAVFVPVAPVSANLLLLQFFFPGPGETAYFGKFGVDVTTDAVPAREGRWMPLILETPTAADPAVLLAVMPVVVVEPRRTPFTLTTRARVPFDGITGFRLRLFPDGTGAAGPRVGRGENGDFLLGEFRVETDAPRSSNLALGRQVYCSRQVQAGLPSKNLTDGFHATWCQPERNPNVPAAFFQMDLGQATALDHVVVRWRQGVDRAPLPQGYEVELLTESGGFDGGMAWTAHRPMERTRAPADVIRAGDGEGEFTGRSLMIRVQGGAGDQPQIAEMEVYPALKAEARQWLADGRALDATGTVTLPAGTGTLSFVPVCRAPAAGVTRCRWQLQGWTEGWMEAVLGEPVHLQPAPPPGDYHLLVQARHTDDIWDTTGLTIKVHAAAPWWRHAPSAVAALTGAGLLIAGLVWYFFTRRLGRRLARTEQHLELHRDRLRISRDMHDEIGARLTSIAMLAERTRRQPAELTGALDRLAHQARSTVEALDTIVWAVNPHHDTVGGLADYLYDYVPSYLESAGMEGLLDFHVARPDRALPLAVRHSLLMAAKEALRNMVNHAHAQHGVVTLTDQTNDLELTITDDGCGLGREVPAGVSHTGLEAMRQRLAEAGGTCEFFPGPEGKGTRVRLAVPLNALQS